MLDSCSPGAKALLSCSILASSAYGIEAQFKSYDVKFVRSPVPISNPKAELEDRTWQLRRMGMSGPNLEASIESQEHAIKSEQEGYAVTGKCSIVLEGDRVLLVRPAPVLGEQKVGMMPMYFERRGEVALRRSTGTMARIEWWRPGIGFLGAGDLIFLADRYPKGVVRPKLIREKQRIGPDLVTEIEYSQDKPIRAVTFEDYGEGKRRAAYKYFAVPSKEVPAGWDFMIERGNRANIEYYRRAPAPKKKPVFPLSVGDRVADFRLSGDRAVHYEYTGDIPSVEWLREHREPGSGMDRTAYLYWIGGALMISGIVLSRRASGMKTSTR